MRPLLTLALLTTSLSLMACSKEPAAAEAGSTAQEEGNAPPESRVLNASEGLPAPTSADILRQVYDLDSGGAPTVRRDDGALASSWYAHAFELKGKRYFTGFTTLTNGEGASAGESVQEDSHVAFGQATFELTGNDGQQAWKALATDGYVGEFGRNDQADAIDANRSAAEHALSDGRLLLAVPTGRFDRGVSYRRFALFLFNRAGEEDQNFRMWTYVGLIEAGIENSAMCEGGVVACTKSTGTLSFEGESVGALPQIRIILTGNTVVGPGEARNLGPQDALVYRFDVDAGRYALME